MSTRLTPAALAARVAARRALVEIASDRKASASARVAAARALLAADAGKVSVQVEQKSKPDSVMTPGKRVTVRSSPEAFRAYHRDSMRRRRAAAKAEKEVEAGKPKCTANRRDPEAYRAHQRTYMAKRRAAAKAAKIEASKATIGGKSV